MLPDKSALQFTRLKNIDEVKLEIALLATRDEVVVHSIHNELLVDIIRKILPEIYIYYTQRSNSLWNKDKCVPYRTLVVEYKGPPLVEGYDVLPKKGELHWWIIEPIKIK
jgi:hypothetical protein